MTIEIAPKTPAPHKSSSSGAPAPKDKDKVQSSTSSANKTDSKASAEGTADAGAQGFMAILASLGDASVPGSADSSAESLSAPGNDVGKQASDPSHLLTQGAAAIALPAPLPADAAAAARSDADPAKAALAAAMAGTNVSKPAGFVDSAQGATEQDGSKRLLQRTHASGAAKSHSAADSLVTGGNGTDATNATGGAASPNAAGVAKGEATPSFDLKMFAAMQEARGASDAKAPEPVSLTSLAGTEKRSGGRVESNTTSADSTYSATPVGVSNNGFAVNAAADASPAADQQVAEQVKYWMSQDVQNAQLKLDGLGDKPVEVSITVTGNEAHVAFRTDEVQARGVLESAGAHLKDMLAREGLLLSGVSVGTSGTSDGGGGERKARQGFKQGVVQVAPLGSVDTGKTMRSASGRSLDLFV